MDKAELKIMVTNMMASPLVQAEIKKLQLPPGYTVCADAWPYVQGESKQNPGGSRRWQGYLYLNESDHPGDSHYGLPLPIAPVMDGETFEVIDIIHLPLKADYKGIPTQPWKPVTPEQHDPDLIRQPLRKDLKPYVVQQPEGPSFSVDGNQVKWQKWQFRVGFHSREGLYLQNITYDGRNVFYRISIPEMAISYGGKAPDSIFSRARSLTSYGSSTSVQSEARIRRRRFWIWLQRQ